MPLRAFPICETGDLQPFLAGPSEAARLFVRSLTTWDTDGTGRRHRHLLHAQPCCNKHPEAAREGRGVERVQFKAPSQKGQAGAH